MPTIDKIDPKGPEFAPLMQYVESYLITVTLYDSDDKVIQEKTMDYGNFEHKKWLGRLSHWAWEQGYTVETKKVE